MPQDIFTKLKAEHKEMKSLMDKVQEKYNARTFEKVIDELTTHMKAEEEVLYRPIMNAKAVHSLILEGYEEHHAANLLIRELVRNDHGSERWMAKFKVLSEVVEHHVKEEEEKIFPKARTLVGDRAADLGKKFEASKKSVLVHA